MRAATHLSTLLQLHRRCWKRGTVPTAPAPIAAILPLLIRNAQQHPADKATANKVRGEGGKGREEDYFFFFFVFFYFKRKECRGILHSLICRIH